MVAAITQHDTKWVSPSPLWPGFSSTTLERQDFQRPAILRFNTDGFMDELLSVMSYYPENLREWKARPETWREPMATPPTAAKLQPNQPLSTFKQTQTRQLKQYTDASSLAAASALVPTDSTRNLPLKLYQPAHQRFYLVTASFVCRKVGLPDRKIDLAKQQKVEFVLRRLLPKDISDPIDPEVCDLSQCDEYAYVLDGDEHRWERVGEAESAANKLLLDNEERLPMFNVGYEEDVDKKRRMLAGYIPVGKREAYLSKEVVESSGADVLPADADAAAAEAAAQKRREAITYLFQLQVGGPWKQLIAMADSEAGRIIPAVGESDWTANAPAIVEQPVSPPADDPSAKTGLQDFRDRIQTISWYVLVDLVQFLKDYVPNVHSYIAEGAAPAGLTAAESDLYDALGDIGLDRTDYENADFRGLYDNSDIYDSLLDALKHVIDHPDIATDLDLVEYAFARDTDNSLEQYQWPTFLFPLADAVNGAPLPDLVVDNPSTTEPEQSQEKIDALAELVGEAIADDTAKPAPEVDPPKVPKQSNTLGWFYIRCVFESPECGPFQPAIVSESTEAFQLASFFDPDAPGRPVNIPMPLDISPAGLRKFNKNARFMVSDMLCGRLKGARKTTLGDLVLSVLPWPFHKDLPEPGQTSCSKGGLGFGMICSLSIPIVTICAFILLIIMVILFDLFFRWLPYLFLCLPIPGLRGKS